MSRNDEKRPAPRPGRPEKGGTHSCPAPAGSGKGLRILLVVVGVLLIAERFVLHGLLERLPRLLRWLIAFTLVTISWSIFYYTDLSSVAQALGALFGVGISGASDAAAVAVLRTYGIWALGAFVLSLPVVPAVAEKLPGKLRGVLEISLTVLLFAASLLFLIGQSYNPFIYFRF